MSKHLRKFDTFSVEEKKEIVHEFLYNQAVVKDLAEKYDCKASMITKIINEEFVRLNVRRLKKNA